MVSELLTNNYWGRQNKKQTVIVTLYQDYKDLITHEKGNHSSVIELHLIRANSAYFLLATESATDKCTECQVKPNPNACNLTQKQDIDVKYKETPMQAQGVV